MAVTEYKVWRKGYGFIATFMFDEDLDEDDGRSRAVAHAKVVNNRYGDHCVVVKVIEEDVWSSDGFDGMATS